MVLLCGCSQNIFPIRGVKKTVETPTPKVENTIATIQPDTIAKEAVETTRAELPVVERQPIPEEWTTIKDDSLVVIESMSGELDSCSIVGMHRPTSWSIPLARRPSQTPYSVTRYTQTDWPIYPASYPWYITRPYAVALTAMPHSYAIKYPTCWE